MGGHLRIAIGDEILMMENAIYSVISPEGCAAILWRDAGKRERPRGSETDGQRSSQARSRSIRS